jgi:hypothetical protein
MLISFLSSLVPVRLVGAGPMTSMSARKITLAMLATLCASVALSALASTPASAYLKHHYILPQITGTPEGAFSNACGIAINPANQDLYVTNLGNGYPDNANFIASYDSAGVYQSNVSNFVLSAFSDGPVCATAVSGVTGDVYVADSNEGVVYVFGALGNYLTTLEGLGGNGVAIDESTGDVYIADAAEGAVRRLNTKNEPAEPPQPLTGLAGPGALAVGSDGEVYVSTQSAIQEFESSGKAIGSIASSSPGLAVDSAGNVYVVSDNVEGVVEEFSSSGVLEGRLSGPPGGRFTFPNDVAVNAAGDLYVEVGATDASDDEDRVDIFGPNELVPDVSAEAPSQLTGTTATLNGTVNPDGLPVKSCEFEYGPTTAYGQSTPCDTTPTGSSPVAVSASLTGLPVGTGYHYRLNVTNANGNNESGDEAFFTLGARIAEESFSEVGVHSATANAQINAEGSPTTYDVEYGTTEAYGLTTPTKTIGATAGAVNVSATLGAAAEVVLQPETTYHFRVVATNADGTSVGADVTFATLSDFAGLPDGRGYELVSPVANANGDVYFPGSGVVGGQKNGSSNNESPLPMQAAADGDAVEYAADPLATGGNGQAGVGEGNQYVATRSPGGGWSTVDLDTRGLDTAPYEALLANELSNSGTSVVPVGSHVLSERVSGLYDSVGGRSILVSVLPPAHQGESGVPVAQANFGGPPFDRGYEQVDYSRVISADGSRIFWTDDEEGPNKEHIYVRENDDRSVPVSAGAARFWTANSDGRYVYYTENETLWRFDVKDETREQLAGEDAGVQGVVGASETGEEGAYVYFVAQGILAAGATQGDCPVFTGTGVGGGEGTTCNLYVWHDGVTTFIATLSGEDDAIIIAAVAGIPDISDGDWTSGLGGRSAQVTPDGKNVVFMSYERLTHYDNHGLAEVYVYDADTDGLSCASCNPIGAPPSGGGALSVSGVGGQDVTYAFMHHQISEDGTRVFFDSSETLVAGDTNGVQDAYEWEREGAGSCQVKNPARQDGGCVYLLSGGTSPDPSFLLDASASGDDVFIITRAQLAPQDTGETYEVYDVRVGASQSLAEQACTGTGCQGLPSAPPPFATPASVTFNGVGNFFPSLAPSPVNAKAKAKPMKCKKGLIKKKGKCVMKPRAKKSTHQKGSK